MNRDGTLALTTTTSSSSGAQRGVRLNARQECEAWRASTHALVRMCMDQVFELLFSGDGIVPMRQGQRMTPSVAFRRYLDRELRAFVRDAADALLAIGVVPVVFRRAHTAGLGARMLVPLVPRHGTYAIYTWHDRGAQRFDFYWVEAAAGGSGSVSPRPDSRVHVFSDLGHDPFLDGTLASSLHSVAPHLRFLTKLKSCATRAESVLCAPPLVTENNGIEDKTDALRASDQLKTGYFVSDQAHLAPRGDTACDEGDSPQYTRSGDECAELLREMRAISLERNSTVEDVFGVTDCWNDEHEQTRTDHVPGDSVNYRGDIMPWVTTHHLANGRKASAIQLPRPRTDLVALATHTSDMVCGVLGVPRSIVLGETGHTRDNAATAREALYRTARQWSKVLERMMQLVYNATFFDHDLVQELRSRVQVRRARDTSLEFASAKQLLNEHDLEDAHRIHCVELRFDMAPHATSETLTFLNARGILPFDAYREYMLRAANIEVNPYVCDNDNTRKQGAKSRVQDPFTREQRMALLTTRKRPRIQRDDGGASESSPPPPEATTTGGNEASSSSTTPS